MIDTAPLIRNICDTARWVAAYRARETARPDALFQDPFALRLTGEHGEDIAESLPYNRPKDSWPFVIRTVLFDQIIRAKIKEDVDLVLNLAAGLDARPYRMQLPATLKWFEVDLPEIFDHKENVLKEETPVCRLERIHLDLSNVPTRRQLFQQIGNQGKQALILSEGLLPYFAEEEVRALANDLAAIPSFRYWIADFPSPGLLRMIQKQLGNHLSRTPLKFGPAEGPHFFRPSGWNPVEVHSLLKTAAQYKRLPWFPRLMAFLPDSTGKQGSRPWSGVCLFQKQ